MGVGGLEGSHDFLGKTLIQGTDGAESGAVADEQSELAVVTLIWHTLPSVVRSEIMRLIEEYE